MMSSCFGRMRSGGLSRLGNVGVGVREGLVPAGETSGPPGILDTNHHAAKGIQKIAVIYSKIIL